MKNLKNKLANMEEAFEVGLNEDRIMATPRAIGKERKCSNYLEKKGTPKKVIIEDEGKEY